MGVTTHYLDGHRHCVSTTHEGKAPTLNIYNDRRCAMTFPTANNPGYFCLFGLKDVVTHRDKFPLQLLAEFSSMDQDRLFNSIVNATRKYNCATVYADCDKDFQSNEVEFGRFLKRKNIRFLGLYDASEFEGFNQTYAGFEAARAPLDEYGRKGLLEIPERSILRQQLASFDLEDMTQYPERRFYAINAFNHIIMSYVLSPWITPGHSYEDNRPEGYGG